LEDLESMEQRAVDGYGSVVVLWRNTRRILPRPGIHSLTLLGGTVTDGYSPWQMGWIEENTAEGSAVGMSCGVAW